VWRGYGATGTKGGAAMGDYGDGIVDVDAIRETGAASRGR
jgi:hypothetical protein